MNPWLACRVILYAYKRKKAVVAVRTWHPLEAGTRQVLLLHGRGGDVFQVAGTVSKVATREGYSRIELQIPWGAAVSLAAWAGKTVREGGTTVLHSYVARIKGAALPPLKLLYEGYVALYGTLIRKALGAPTGVYILEIRLGGASLLVPARYYRHERQDRKGGDAGAFQLPIDVFRTLVEWGLHELGSDYDYVYMKVWRPESPALQLGKRAEASAL
jgi:hypothetical protein